MDRITVKRGAKWPRQCLVVYQACSNEACTFALSVSVRILFGLRETGSETLAITLGQQKNLGHNSEIDMVEEGCFGRALLRLRNQSEPAISSRGEFDVR